MLWDASWMTVRGLACGRVSGEGGMDEDGGGVVRKRGWEGDVDRDADPIYILLHMGMKVGMRGVGV